MRTLLLLTLLASAAAAQSPDTLGARRPLSSSVVVRALAGATVSVGLPFLVYYGSSGEQEEAAAAAVIAIPLTAAIGAHYLGTDGSGDFGRTLAGAGLGALAGVTVLAIGGIVSASGVCGELCFVPLAPGAVALILGPAIGAAIRYRGGVRAEPVAFVGPDGERAAGVALRVQL
ncbi:MAG TPA: hypothetical protein VGB53_06775 [Rubricoccaceae bacterium]|jgi:hypothetical protein